MINDNYKDRKMEKEKEYQTLNTFILVTYTWVSLNKVKSMTESIESYLYLHGWYQ